MFLNGRVHKLEFSALIIEYKTNREQILLNL